MLDRVWRVMHRCEPINKEEICWSLSDRMLPVSSIIKLESGLRSDPSYGHSHVRASQVHQVHHVGEDNVERGKRQPALAIKTFLSSLHETGSLLLDTLLLTKKKPGT